MTTFFMDTDPRLSLVFVNFRSAKRLALALASLFEKEGSAPSFEVIVVNHDETEEAELGLLEKQYPFTLTHAENKGFGAGANLGARMARGALLGFLNPDVLWRAPFLGRVVSALERDSRKIVGITLVGQEGKIEPWGEGKAPTLLELCRNNLSPLRTRRLLAPADLDWVSGAALFVSQETFQSVGGFDEAFFLYFEDVDLCVRAKQEGVLISRDKESRLFHQGGASFVSRSEQKQFFRRSQEQYFTKHRPHFEVRLLRALHAFLRFFGL